MTTETTKVVLRDKAEGYDGTVEVEIKSDADFIAIAPKGYGEACAQDGHGTPVLLELWEGDLRVLVFNDINRQDPKIISMKKALESSRITIETFRSRIEQGYYSTENGVAQVQRDVLDHYGWQHADKWVAAMNDGTPNNKEKYRRVLDELFGGMDA